jgi:L-asparaginase
MKPKVTVIVLGGTITMVPQATGGIAPSVTGDDLVAAVPALDAIADIDVVTPFLVPGASLSFAQMATVADMVAAAGANGAGGIVVVQGTDTIDETSFLIDLACESGPDHAAIVVTGAMRGATAPGADGHANLLAAVTVAASPEARGLGTLVVLNDEVHAARYVQKTDTGLPSAFAAPGLGPIGTVTEGRFRLRLIPTAVSAPAVSLAEAAPVAIVQTGLGDDGRLIDAIADAGFQGAVVAAMGAGHVPAATVERLEKLATTMPVVLSTRVPGGAVFEKSYGFAGSEIDLIRRGLIPAGILPPHKARLLLACLVGAGFDTEEILGQFQTFA